MTLGIKFLVFRFFYRILEFLRHWYIRSAKLYTNAVLNEFEKLDRFFALKVTLRHFFEPLYKDYSIIGYVLGFLFRSIRVLSAVFAYLLIFLFALAIYVLWLLIIPYIFLRVIFG